MITKGILKSINYNDNTCLVRLPLFETAGADTEVVLKAVFLTQPGNYNGYIENDIVFVDFENNKLDAPVVIGKLYLGAVKEAQNAANASINVSNLTVTSKATLPLDTKIINTKPTTSAIVDVDGDVYSYSSLEDILKAIRKTESSINDLHLQNSDSIAKIETLYLSQEAGLEAPSANNEAWSSNMPEFQEGYSIWQKTTTYNNSGQILNYEIICLSDLATVSSYWLNCSSMIHSGTQQKNSLKVTAMVKLGSNVETKDTSAVLEYKWQSAPTWTRLETLSYEFEIASNACINEDLLIRAYHGATEYETETIKFISQNGPTLVLSNYSAQIEYDSTGQNKIELGATVSSEAELYYNGKLVEDFTDYKWTLNGCKASQNSEATEITTNPITISELTASSATATCNVTYNGTPCTATFTITKARQGHTPYALHIENDFVSIATNSDGDLPDNSLDRTTHTVVVTRDNTKQAIRIYDSSTTTNITERIYIKATTTNVKCDFSTTDNEVTLSAFTDSEGTINYILYEKSGNTEIALASATFKVVKIIPGKDGKDGASGITYWLVSSANTHLGTQQDTAITITAMTKSGDTKEAIDNTAKLAWRFKDGTWSGLVDSSITISTFENKDIEVIATHGDTIDSDPSLTDEGIYEFETITYAPLNTPVLDLSNDSAAISYYWETSPNPNVSSQLKKSKDSDTVSSTATVYYNNEKVPEVTYSWSPTHEGITIAEVREDDKIVGSQITVKDLPDNKNTAEYICTATVPVSKSKWVMLTKTFTVVKQIQGNSVTDYWLKVSTPIHTGSTNMSDITVTAMKREGTDGTEKIDHQAFIWYKWNKTGSNWRLVPDTNNDVTIAEYCTFTITKEDIEDADLEIIATHTPETTNFNNLSEKDKYDSETITYSPATTPVIDLSQDKSDLNYADNTKLDPDETETCTARLYLNGVDISSQANWTIESTDCTASLNNTTATVEAINDGSLKGTVTFKATIKSDATNGAEKYKGESYTKTFTITKKLKGDKGENGFNTISLHIENDKDSVPCTSDGTPASSYKWAEQTKHTITAFDGITQITFKTVTKTVPTTDSEDYTLVYEDEGVGYKPGTTSNILNYEASVESLSADTGKVIYKLYKGKTLFDSVSFVITKNKAGASTIKLSISNDFASIPCDSAKEPLPNTDWSITEHTLKVLDGLTEKDFSLVTTKTGSDYEVVYKFTNLTAKIEAKTITLTALTAEVGYITYDLYKDGTLVDTAKFEATKLIPGAKGEDGTNGKDGADGKNGEDATSYYILATAYQIKKSKNETTKTPEEIIFTAYSKTGTESPKTISGYWTYAIDGDTTDTNGNSDSSTQTITTTNITKELKVNFYLDADKTKLADRETIPVVADGDDLSDHYVQANVDTIKYDPKATPSYSPAEVTFKFYSQVGLNEPTRLTLSEAYYTTTVDGGVESDKISITDDIKDYGITVTAGTGEPAFNQSYTVTLYDSKEDFLDSETISIVANGTGAMSCVVESSAGTSFKKPFGDRTTTLTAYLYEGTEELDTNREWFYEWYWFNNTKSGDQPTVIERTTENSEVDEEGNFINSYKITLKLSDLENKSVYFIAYTDGEHAEGTEVAILNVARLGLMALGK